MSNSRIPRWVSLLILGVGLLMVAIPGFWLYLTLTATKLHPDPGKIVSTSNSPPPPQWSRAVEQSRDLVRASVTEQNLPGISVAVGVDGKIVWAEGFGFANLEDSSPVTLDHRFRIGTVSIPLTSAGIGLLLEEGRIKLDDEIQMYVPEFGVPHWPATIRQVMGNIGGLKGEDPDEGVLTSSHCEHPTDALALFAKQPLSKAGGEYQYSTFGWVLLSEVVERAANKPLTSFLEERVFRPLGMLDTVRDSDTEPVAHEATSYFPRFFARPIYGVKPLYKYHSSCYAGSSGYLSTPSDLVRFGMGMNGGKLLRRDTVQLLQTPQRLASGAETGYGLGWELKTIAVDGQPVRTAGHEGEIFVGTSASLLTLPERGIAVAVTTNASSFVGTPAVTEKIAAAFASGR